jgi:hypothetical protein
MVYIIHSVQDYYAAEAQFALWKLRKTINGAYETINPLHWYPDILHTQSESSFQPYKHLSQ